MSRVLKLLIMTFLFVNISIVYAGSPYYRDAVETNGFLYVSGQNAQKANESLKNQTIQQQTKESIELLKKTLKRYGYSLNDVVEVSVALAKQGDFAKFNSIYSEYFTNRPARSTALGVLHQNIGAKVEISLIAYKKKEVK